jgi:hypothetical protein
MVDREPEGPNAQAKEERPQDKRRARYERPVLTHLGSVNRLTLSVSVLGRNDGSKSIKTSTNG